MRHRPQTLLDRLLRRSPAQPFFAWRAAKQLTVLAYHGIDDPDCFSAQLDLLRRKAAPVTLAEATAAVHGTAGLPRRAVLVTFDDGDPSLLDRALPLLADRGIPAVAFVIAGLIDGDEAPWWEQVYEFSNSRNRIETGPYVKGSDLVKQLKSVSDEERRRRVEDLRTKNGPPLRTPQLRSQDLLDLESAGVVIGNHTLTHPCLPRCTDDVLRREITQAHERLTALLTTTPEAFAYPNGDWDPRAESCLADLGYRSGFVFDHRISRFPVRNPLRVSRVRVNSYTNLDRFELILSGLHPALHRLRGGV